MEYVYAVLALTWLVGGTAVHVGFPIEAGGRLAGTVSWGAYAALNLSLAALLVAFTRELGALPEGAAKDRLFLRFLCIVLLQPLVTASAFVVLYRIVGVVYHLDVPPLPGIQEGI